MTRRLRDGVLTVALEADGQPRARPRAPAAGRRRSRSRSRASAPEAALAKLRFVLAVDDDHEPFLRRFVDDPLIGRAVRRLRGMRPLRTATVTHALLKAVCGQLIQARAARDLEAKLLRRSATPFRRPPPSSDAGDLRRELPVPSRARGSRGPQGQRAHPALARVGRRAPARRRHARGGRPHRARARAGPLVGRRRLPPGARPLRARPRRRPRAASSSARRCSAGGRRPRTRGSCSSRTANGRAWRASTCSPRAA